MNDALAKGARLITSGKHHPLGRNFFQPTVLAEVSDDMQLARGDLWHGCYLLLFHRRERVIRRLNETPYGLIAYFYTRDLVRVFRVETALESGLVGINEYAVSIELWPFGCLKESGLSREGSVLGMEDYVEVKTLHIGGL